MEDPYEDLTDHERELAKQGIEAKCDPDKLYPATGAYRNGRANVPYGCAIWDGKIMEKCKRFGHWNTRSVHSSDTMTELVTLGFAIGADLDGHGHSLGFELHKNERTTP